MGKLQQKLNLRYTQANAMLLNYSSHSYKVRRLPDNPSTGGDIWPEGVSGSHTLTIICALSE